jgi:hypothetical protein
MGFSATATPPTRLTWHQTQLTHDVADQLGPAVVALTGEGGVDAAVAVRTIGVIKNREDQPG